MVSFETKEEVLPASGTSEKNQQRTTIKKPKGFVLPLFGILICLLFCVIGYHHYFATISIEELVERIERTQDKSTDDKKLLRILQKIRAKIVLNLAEVSWLKQNERKILDKGMSKSILAVLFSSHRIALLWEARKQYMKNAANKNSQRQEQNILLVFENDFIFERSLSEKDVRDNIYDIEVHDCSVMEAREVIEARVSNGFNVIAFNIETTPNQVEVYITHSIGNDAFDGMGLWETPAFLEGNITFEEEENSVMYNNFSQEKINIYTAFPWAQNFVEEFVVFMTSASVKQTQNIEVTERLFIGPDLSLILATKTEKIFALSIINVQSIESALNKLLTMPFSVAAVPDVFMGRTPGSSDVDPNTDYDHWQEYQPYENKEN